MNDRARAGARERRLHSATTGQGKTDPTRMFEVLEVPSQIAEGGICWRQLCGGDGLKQKGLST